MKVSTNGSVSVNANIQDWWSGLKVMVPTSKSCAYHLSYLNQDRFFVCAEGWLWAQQGGWFGSDLKLKKNINPIKSPLATIVALQGIQFDYKNLSTEDKDDSLNSNKKQRIGFIAQDVEKVLPGVVKTMPDGNKAISYTDIIPLTVEAIKEQQKQIDRLAKIIEEQQNKIDNLVKVVDAKKKN